MMRAATALIAILSVFSAPVASALCRDCCHQPVKPRSTQPLCHDNVQAHMVHSHSGQAHHMHTVAQKSGAVVHQCDRQLQESRLNCQSDVCASAIPVKVTIASAPAHELRISSRLFARAPGSSATIAAIASSARPPDVCRKGIESSSPASAPLRI
jgi:hypothetical protein